MTRRAAAVAAALSLVVVAGVTTAPPPARASATIEVTGAVLEWSGNLEMQSSPPLPGCNYFSAGVSDGSQEQYRTDEGAVGVRVASGTPTWATKCAGATTGALGQRVVLTAGTGTLDPATGASTITWSGTWTVNFYTGLLPFTVSDPVLTVAPGGSGTLTATLGGWAGEIGSTTRTPLPPQPGVVVADLTGVPTGSTGFVVTPRYTGVLYDAPAAGTPQNRTRTGWGAWPQSFVAFHEQTGLSSYWYSSGGSADTKKPPAPITVRYSDAPAAVTSTSLSVTPTRAVAGSSIRLTSAVTPAVPGTVRFTDGTRALATVTLTAGGSVAYTTAQLAPGGHALRATFLPANPTAAASSASTVVSTTVVAAVSTATLRLTPTKPTASTRVRARVTVTLAGTPLRAAGPVRITKGSKVLARGTVAGGTVTLTLPRLKPGKHRLVARWAATPTATSSTSQARTLRVVR